MSESEEQELRAFPKPSEIEGRQTLSAEKKRRLRFKLFHDQKGYCGCGCGQRMSIESDRLDTATLEHFSPNKMGCKKDDGPKNVFSVWRWDCNFKKGSKRIPRQ